jgi:hypothetical protein
MKLLWELVHDRRQQIATDTQNDRDFCEKRVVMNGPQDRRSKSQVCHPGTASQYEAPLGIGSFGSSQ